MGTPVLLFDLHLHTEHSHDCTSRVDDVLATARARGLAGVAVADHESFEGARQATRRAAHHGLLVIPAMQVATEEGDVIGLFLRAPLAGRSFAEVTDEIRAQGGVVYYPHPFLQRRELPARVIERVDVLEVWNARGEAPGGSDRNARAEALAERSGIAWGAGSDAHFLWEIGRGAVDLGEVWNLADVRARLLERGAKQMVRRTTSPWAGSASLLVRAGKTRRREAWAAALHGFGRTLLWCTFGRARAAVQPALGWPRSLARAARRILDRATS